MTPVWHMVEVTAAYTGWFRAPRVAVRGASLTVHAGERVGLVGPSGGGKSSLARVGLGLLPLRTGQMEWFGEPTSRWPRSRWRALHQRVQWLPQRSDALLHPLLPVGRLLERSAARFHPEASAARKAREALAGVGLEHRGDALPHQLSGGEQRRVAIARIRLAAPDVILADEPTAGLDAERKAGILQLLLERRTADAAVVIISHDIAALASVCDRLLVVHEGAVIESLDAHALRSGTALPVAPQTAALLDASGWRSVRGRRP